MKKYKILILHGPNLNLLGERETSIYGKLSLTAINSRCRKKAMALNAETRFFQTNSEGALIDCIHKNRKWADAIIINPAAYTHYSYAIRDAIAAVDLPTVEVHLSDIKKRESFRRKSVIRAVCIRQISGLGVNSYLKGIEALIQLRHLNI